MAALELDAGAPELDPGAFAEFLAEQPDLGTKWAPRFVRVVDAIPLTATGKVDRKPLRAERWDAAERIWWRPAGAEGYVPFTASDAEALRQQFVDAGRGAVLQEA
jgi:fatty-acyl-CoA synthase